MDSSYDLVIAGAGLAGAFSAFNLSRRRRVLVLEADVPASGASGAGAGLVNPFMARKANPIWRWTEALEALESTLQAAGCRELFRRSGLFRPASDERQAGWFKDRAKEYPNHVSWLDPDASLARWPAVRSPFGGLFVERGGSIDLVSLVEALLNAAGNLGCEIHDETTVTGYRATTNGVTVTTNRGDIGTRRFLICAGAGFNSFPVLSELPLHPLKGQTVTLARPYRLGSNIPCLSGSGYLVPYPDQLVLGSTYHHEFDGTEPTADDTEEILEKVGRMIDLPADVRVLHETAGVRITVPSTRLPLIGPVDDTGRVWALTGLGSKGLLMGALLGRSLGGYLDAPDAIPSEIAITRADHS